MGFKDAWARQQARADAAKDERTAGRKAKKDEKTQEKERIAAQHAEVEAWMAEHHDDLVTQFANLHVFTDRLIVLHHPMPLTASQDHEVHQLAGLRARIDREGGGSYSRGTLTRTAIGAGSWQKKETQQVTQFVTIEGPNTFVQFMVGQFPTTKHTRFVTQFNAAAAQATPAQTEPAPTGDDVIGKLRHIGELHEAGIIDDDEFAALKARFING
jgi:hypothetical protein